jgi:hypothetical protein
MEVDDVKKEDEKNKTISYVSLVTSIVSGQKEEKKTPLIYEIADLHTIFRSEI